MTNHPSFTIDLIAEVAEVLAELPCRAEHGSELDGLRRREAARAIVAIPAIAEAQERIAELEREVEGWAYAAQYPEG